MSNRQVGPVAKSLIEAKKRVEAGWVRFTRHAPNGGVCALGALEAHEWSDYAEDDCPEAVVVLASSAAVLWPNEAPSRCTINIGHISNAAKAVAYYNNMHPDGKDAVIRLFDHAISKAISEGK